MGVECVVDPQDEESERSIQLRLFINKFSVNFQKLSRGREMLTPGRPSTILLCWSMTGLLGK